MQRAWCFLPKHNTELDEKYLFINGDTHGSQIGQGYLVLFILDGQSSVLEVEYSSTHKNQFRKSSTAHNYIMDKVIFSLCL